jgi:HAD superfamily hydrolase (TIGR01509 family)
MPKIAIFDVDGTLVDSVDLHAIAWQKALNHFGHQVTFEQARSQIGKGGDQLMSEFLSERDRRDHGKDMEAWRGELFKSQYLPLVRPFSAVPELLRCVRDAGWDVAIASSAKASELDVYLEIAKVQDLVDIKISADDVEQSKPAPDVFQVALKMSGMAGADAIAIGDTPYDAEAAGKAGISTIGLLCGGFAEYELRKAGCVAVYPGPAGLLACFAASPFAEISPGERDHDTGLSAGVARSGTMENGPMVREIYRSSNGDRWQLIRNDAGHRFVRHEANAPSGGMVTVTSLDDFLRIPGAGPETEELRRILREENRGL